MCQIVKHLLTVFAQYDIREVIAFIYNKVYPLAFAFSSI